MVGGSSPSRELHWGGHAVLAAHGAVPNRSCVTATVAQLRTQIADRPQLYPPMSASPEIIGTGDGVTTIFSLTYENYIPGTLTVYTAPAPSAGVAPTFTAFSAASPINVATTSATAISPGVNTVAPASMTNITVNAWLRIDPGLSTQEDVQVTAVGGGDSNFTATFLQAHAAGFSIIGTPAYSIGAPSQGTDETNATNAIVTFLTAPSSGTIVAARYQATAFADSDLSFYLTEAQNDAYPDDRMTLKRAQYDIIPIILADQRRLELLRQGDFSVSRADFVAALKTTYALLRDQLAGGPQPETNVPAVLIASSRAGRYLPYK